MKCFKVKEFFFILVLYYKTLVRRYKQNRNFYAKAILLADKEILSLKEYLANLRKISI